MADLITTAKQMGDLLSLFGNTKLVYDGPEFKFTDMKTRKKSAWRTYKAPLNSIFTSEQMDSFKEKTEECVKELNDKRKAFVDSGSSIYKPDYDYEISVPFDDWYVNIHTSLDMRTCYQQNNQFNLNLSINLLADDNRYGRMLINCCSMYTSGLEENNLLSKFSETKAALSQKINNLYQLALREATIEGFVEKNDCEPDYWGLDSIVSGYATLTKFNLSDRDF